MLSVAVLLIAVGMLAATPQSHAATRCEAAPVSPRVRTELEAAFRRAAGLPSDFRLRSNGALHYGSCAGTHYGFAEFTPARSQAVTEQQGIDLQDHSFLYVQAHGTAWRDLPLQRICAPGPLPAALAKQWHLSFCSA
jgi:hypothetical protein